MAPAGRARAFIPLPSLDLILARAGVFPLDTGPANELGAILESVAAEIVDHARQLAAHAGRVTIMKSDITLAHDTWKHMKHGDGHASS